MSTPIEEYPSSITTHLHHTIYVYAIAIIENNRVHQPTSLCSSIHTLFKQMTSMRCLLAFDATVDRNSSMIRQKLELTKGNNKNTHIAAEKWGSKYVMLNYCMVLHSRSK